MGSEEAGAHILRQARPLVVDGDPCAAPVPRLDPDGDPGTPGARLDGVHHERVERGAQLGSNRANPWPGLARLDDDANPSTSPLERGEGDLLGELPHVDVLFRSALRRQREEGADRPVDARDLAAGGRRHLGRIGVVGKACGELVHRQADGVERIAQGVRHAASDLAHLSEVLALLQGEGLAFEGLEP